jgi:hypothetical protein
LKEGDWLSLDGTTGEVFWQGQHAGCRPELLRRSLKFMEWADEFRGKFGVRANADIPRDAKAARKFGAEGIGLCRTEHMFFAEDRIEHMQAMILARDEKTAARPCQAPAHAAQGFRRPVHRHGRLPGGHPHARSAAARVPAQARRPDGGRRHLPYADIKKKRSWRPST